MRGGCEVIQGGREARTWSPPTHASSLPTIHFSCTPTTGDHLGRSAFQLSPQVALCHPSWYGCEQGVSQICGPNQFAHAGVLARQHKHHHCPQSHPVIECIKLTCTHLTTCLSGNFLASARCAHLTGRPCGPCSLCPLFSQQSEFNAAWLTLQANLKTMAWCARSRVHRPPVLGPRWVEEAFLFTGALAGTQTFISMHAQMHTQTPIMHAYRYIHNQMHLITHTDTIHTYTLLHTCNRRAHTQASE